VSYIITDIDGTLTTSGDTPNQPFIDWLKSQANDHGAEVIIVSARSIQRLAETERWLNENSIPYEEIHLQDFGDVNPATSEAFKAYKYSKLQEEYADEIEMLVDNDAEARDAAEGMGIPAYTPEQAIALTIDDESDDEMRVLIDAPDYVQAAAAKGITYYEQGLAGDGLQPETVEEARQLRAGRVQDEKVTRLRAWILRHRGDWEGVARNSDANDPDFPGPGAVAAYLWGVDPTNENGTERVLEWADRALAPLESEDRETIDVKEIETRALPLGDFTVTESEDGQKTFTGYAALFGAPSAGLPFTEVIAPGAFKRTLSRVAGGKKIVSFLFGHDETRALATTLSGRLALSEDDRGLRVEAKLDPADPDAAGVISKLTHEAGAMGMSFGFTIPKNGDEWDEDVRTLREVNLFEVSVLSAGQTPAYPSTLGLTSVRKVAPRMGVDADRLISAIESIKSATPLTEADVEVLDTVRERLGPKPEAIDPTIAAARLVLAKMESEAL
jgi:HK97 family phage prohead protease